MLEKVSAAMSYRLEIRIPGQPRPMNEVMRMRNHHARNSYMKKWKEIVGILVLRKKPERPLQKCHIRAVLHNARNFDYDGAVASLKPIVDGLQIHGVIFNDSYKRTGPWDVTQQLCKKGQEFVELTVEER